MDTSELIRETLKNGEYNIESETTLSIGVTSTWINRKNTTLFESADKTRYHAKKAHKNETVYDR